MSILAESIIYPPRHLPSSEERMYRASEHASLLERLRVNHPELFSLKVTLDDPGVRCMKNKFNLDLTKDDNLIAILLRPHANLICNGRPVGTLGWQPANYMYEVVKDALGKLNLDFAAANRLGATWNLSHEYTDDTNKHAAISFLGQAINLLVNSKAAGLAAADRIAAAETARRMARAAAPASKRAMLISKRRNGKTPIVEADLLGLHSASAAAKPVEIDLLDMNAIRKKEIADDLAGLFGGASRTRKHKQRKHRKARKSRKHSRK